MAGRRPKRGGKERRLIWVTIGFIVVTLVVTAFLTFYWFPTQRVKEVKILPNSFYEVEGVGPDWIPDELQQKLFPRLVSVQISTAPLEMPSFRGARRLGSLNVLGSRGTKSSGHLNATNCEVLTQLEAARFDSIQLEGSENLSLLVLEDVNLDGLSGLEDLQKLKFLVFQELESQTWPPLPRPDRVAKLALYRSPLREIPWTSLTSLEELAIVGSETVPGITEVDWSDYPALKFIHSTAAAHGEEADFRSLDKLLSEIRVNNAPTQFRVLLPAQTQRLVLFRSKGEVEITCVDDGVCQQLVFRQCELDLVSKDAFRRASQLIFTDTTLSPELIAQLARAEATTVAIEANGRPSPAVWRALGAMPNLETLVLDHGSEEGYSYLSAGAFPKLTEITIPRHAGPVLPATDRSGPTVHVKLENSNRRVGSRSSSPRRPRPATLATPLGPPPALPRLSPL